MKIAEDSRPESVTNGASRRMAIKYFGLSRHIYCSAVSALPNSRLERIAVARDTLKATKESWYPSEEIINSSRVYNTHTHTRLYLYTCRQAHACVFEM